ncbi:MAG: hypothetical protein AAF329_18725 [Cyanobacteria bacterium P01_A01_bin.17]
MERLQDSTTSVETLICGRRVTVSAEQRYDSLIGIVQVFFGSEPIQARVIFSHGSLHIDQTTQFMGLPPGDICAFIAANIEPFTSSIEAAALT